MTLLFIVATLHDIGFTGVLLSVFWYLDDSPISPYMYGITPIESLNHTAFDADSGTRGTVVLKDDVHDAGAASLAKVTVHVAATASTTARPLVKGESVEQVGRERQNAIGGKNGRCAKGRRRLLLTLATVAVINGERGI